MPSEATSGDFHVFISYARSDNENADASKRWLNRLLEHLQPLVLQDRVSAWADTEIEKGEQWDNSIKSQLLDADVAVLLVSPAFLASKYIRNSELPALLVNAMNDGRTVIPVILRESLFAETKFKYPDPERGPNELSLSVFQSANPPSKPLNALEEHEQDAVLLSVARRILELARRPRPRPISLPDDAFKTRESTTPRASPGLRPRNETIFTASVSDQPAKTDALGFEPYVKAIADFLDNERTAPPLTLSIEGEWGSGKSSFMSQLEALLRKGGNLTVKFNAWRHDKVDELWAAFALDFIEQISSEQSFLRRVRANASLRLRRYDWAGGWLDLVRASAMWLMVLCVILGAPALLYYKGTDWVSWLTKSIGDGSVGSEITGWLVGLGGFSAGLVAIASLWIKLRSYVGNPVAVDLKKHLKFPNYEDRVSFIENFHKDFKHIVGSYVGKKKVYVFIDDLDRCEVPKAADLMQAINMMIANDPQLIFIIGMDREKIAAGLAVKHEKLIPYLVPLKPSAADAAAPPRSDGQKLDPVRGLEYGYRFIEKFIQLPFRVPQPGKQELRFLLDRLDVTAKTDEWPRPRRWLRGLTLPAFSRALGRRPGASDGPTPAVANARADVTPRPALTPEQTVRRRQMLNLLNGKAETETVRAIVLMVAPILDTNPRRIKQFINQFRLKAHIANETGLFDVVDDAHPGDALTLEQLGKFVALTQRYPRLLVDLDADNELLNKLQYRASGSELPEHYKASGAVVEWEKEKPLTELLRHGVPSGDSITSSAYSLADLKIGKLLQVSPRVPRQAPAENAQPENVSGDSHTSDGWAGDRTGSGGSDGPRLGGDGENVNLPRVRPDGRESTETELELMYLRELYALEEALGPEHPRVVANLNSLASLYSEQGRYEDAARQYVRALNLRTKALGPRHLDVAESLINLALMYNIMHRFNEAESLYLRALSIQEEALGPDHPVVADSAEGLANLYRAMGRHTEAEVLYARSRNILDKVAGPLDVNS